MSTLLPKEQMVEVCPIAGGVSDRTLKRWENTGRFPARRNVTKEIYGWLDSELAEFQSDPATWQARQRGAA